MRFTAAIVAMVLFVTLVTIFLFATHAEAAASNDACFEQLLLRWNEFATDANKHAHTVEAKPANEQKAHQKLDREWQAVKALSCW